MIPELFSKWTVSPTAKTCLLEEVLGKRVAVARREPPDRLSDYSRGMERVLRESDYQFDQPGKGDHELWFSPISNSAFRCELRKIESRHTANAVLEQAGFIEAVLMP